MTRHAGHSENGRVREPGGDSRHECPECGRMVTPSPTREGVEYGHARGWNGKDRCTRRPDSVDPSSPRANHYAGHGGSV